ncbi:hypothetical protein SAMD00079811_69680 [Scytonema sp. HK-05]|nr:hypothetical protein SAMD00079811_69680 [Scytonema sp. HK-05]
MLNAQGFGINAFPVLRLRVVGYEVWQYVGLERISLTIASRQWFLTFSKKANSSAKR